MPILYPTCEQLKKEYDSIRSEEKKISSIFQNEIPKKTFSRTRELKKEIVERIKTLRESIVVPDKVFLAELNKEETTRQLRELLRRVTTNLNEIVITEENYEEIEKIFSTVDSSPELNNLRYECFVSGLHQWFEGTKAWLQKYIDTGNYSSVEQERCIPCCMHFTSLIHSVFLNKFLKSNLVLRVKKKLPPELQEVFACFLKQGKIYINEVGSEAGCSMKGGELNIKKAKRSLGSKIWGGTVNVVETYDFVGYGMCGGIMNIGKTRDCCFHNMKGGVALVDSVKGYLADHFDQGTILINNIQGITNLDHLMPQVRSSVYHYNHATRSYFLLEEKRSFFGTKYQSAQVVKTPNDLQQFFQQRHGLRIIKNLKNIPHPTQDLDHVILVLYQTPKDNIGEGMKGGVLILEDQKISKEEVKKRLSPQREGGLIMVRVSDPDDPSQTKLEVVE